MPSIPTKKLSLDEFIKSNSLFYEEPEFHKNSIRTPLIESKYSGGYSIYDLVKFLLNHTGVFLIESNEYKTFSYNEFNLYFYGENLKEGSMIIFDPILNIEKVNNTFNITTYPNKSITISMKD